LAVAERLGYTPNPAARALESGRTNTVALVLPDITNPYFFGLIKGAERAAAAAGHTLVIGDTEENPTAEQRVLRTLGPAVDGFVVCSSRLPDADLLAAARQEPVTLVNRQVSGLDSVVSDYQSGTRQIVDHLASLGHRGFVFMGGPPESWSGARRWRGLQGAARSRGLSAVRQGPYQPTLAGGAAAADSALASGATALVAHNDLLAIGVLGRLSERGVHVPGGVSVVGFDDIFGSEFCAPPLTTLAERAREVGGRAVENLLMQMQRRNSRPTRLVLPTQLLVRRSTGPPPG
ncbi:MAG: LacI family transcriptional regulator, partial [Actinobacteria bacterium]|nr:LacI family transcriptional regulator [Actinomycetota bacterium]